MIQQSSQMAAEATLVCRCKREEMPWKTYAAPMGALADLWHRDGQPCLGIWPEKGL